MKNLFRRPLVMGVSFSGLLALAFLTLCLMISLGPSRWANITSGAVAVIGYIGLRLCNRFMIEGWEDEFFYPIEKRLRCVSERPRVDFEAVDVEVLSPDTLEKSDMIYEKEKLTSLLWNLKKDESQVFEFLISEKGCNVRQIKSRNKAGKGTNIDELYPACIYQPFVYSLKALPVTTNPLSMFEIMSGLAGSSVVLIRVTGLGFAAAKIRVEGSRRRNARTSSHLQSIDSEVSFEESSRVLEAMSRGEETIAEFSMIILRSEVTPDLDPALFHLEKNRELSLLSVLSLRTKHFRSHIVRLLTIADFVPSLMDPVEVSTSILKTVRNKDLYFSPLDSRLEALHWLVVGATGTGKSFFTGAVLTRLIQSGVPMTVLFVDHNRSFKRTVKAHGGTYLEPQSMGELKTEFSKLLETLELSGTVEGVELSDLLFEEKKEAAFFLLSQIESFLRFRKSLHPVYIVLDECWNFLRDEPVMVQRAFREFRKLNGAVVAITQSLSDFLSDTAGKSILQNAPLRILLRQGEDPEPYKGILGLNAIEVSKLRMLKQKRGEYSECLIKTSFLSKIARLYPSQKEYALLRTDNLRAELFSRDVESNSGAEHA